LAGNYDYQRTLLKKTDYPDSGSFWGLMALAIILPRSPPVASKILQKSNQKCAV